MPQNNTGLRVNISGDADELRAELARAQRQVQGFAGNVQRIDRRTGALNSRFASLATSARTFGAALVAALGVQAIRNVQRMTAELTRANQQMQLVAREAGETVAGVRALQTAFAALGSQADVRDALIDGQDRIAEALTITNSEAALAADSLARFGFNIENLRGRTGIDLLTTLSDELRRAQREADRLGEAGGFRNLFETLAGDAEKFAPLLQDNFRRIIEDARSLQAAYQLTDQQEASLAAVQEQTALLSANLNAAFTKTIAENADELHSTIRALSTLIPVVNTGLSGVVTVVDALAVSFSVWAQDARDFVEWWRRIQNTNYEPIVRDIDGVAGALVGGLTPALAGAATQQEATVATTRDLAEELRKLENTGTAELGFQVQALASERQLRAIQEINRLQTTITDPVDLAGQIAALETRNRLELDQARIQQQVANLNRQIAAAEDAELTEQVVDLTRERDALIARQNAYQEFYQALITGARNLGEEQARIRQEQQETAARLALPAGATLAQDFAAQSAERIQALNRELELSEQWTALGRLRVQVTQELNDALDQELLTATQQVDLAAQALDHARATQGVTAEQLEPLERVLRLAQENERAVRSRVELERLSVGVQADQEVALRQQIDLNQNLVSIADTARDAFSTFASSAVTGLDSIGDAARRLGQTILDSILNRLIDVGVEAGLGFLGIGGTGGGAAGAADIPLGPSGQSDSAPLLGPTGQQSTSALRGRLLSGPRASAVGGLGGNGDVIIIADTEPSEDTIIATAELGARVAERGISRKLGRNNPLDERLYAAVQSKRNLGAGG